MAEDQGLNTRGEGATSQAERIKPYRWKPGQSGNPGGRPKNESMVSLLRRILEQEHNGKALKEILAERLVKEALAGKFPFLKELLDRMEGLPGKEPKGNEPVRIVVADYRTQTERAGTADDIRALMAPETPRVREFTKLRDFYEQCPAPVPPGYVPPSQGEPRGT